MTAWSPPSAVLILVMTTVTAPLAGCSALRTPARTSSEAMARDDALRRARVWAPTNIRRMNVRRGPGGKGAFAPDALVECRYRDRDLSGATPKFSCVRAGGDVLKVKYGETNGEVYAEVAATRLLWALGFGADHMYPVRVRCLDCPETPGGPPRPGTSRVFDIAAIERKLPGREIEGADGPGWTWPELEVGDPARGGASRAERDALKLLAAMLQHTDSKRAQQRLICLDDRKTPSCRRPFMLVSDLGKTFGKANLFNRDEPGSVNLEAWASAPVWVDGAGCRANLGASLTGTLENPVITDSGRRFLLNLLQQLSDRQLRDLFTVARFPERARAARAPGDDVDAWVAAFKGKVKEIASRSCVMTGRAS
jgi:hypothetical protein